jgi:hypothetical protein
MKLIARLVKTTFFVLFLNVNLNYLVLVFDRLWISLSLSFFALHFSQKNDFKGEAILNRAGLKNIK